GDLGRGAPEVQVDVVDALVDEQPDGVAHVGWIAAVELDGAGRLVRPAAGEQPGHRVPLEETARRDHLRDVERRPEAATEAPERVVRDARHRRQDDGRPHGEPPERERPELARARRRDLLVRQAREAGPAGRARERFDGDQSSYLKESFTLARYARI